MLRFPNIKFLIVGMPKSRKMIFKNLAKVDPRINDKVLILEPTKDDHRLMQLMQICDVIGHGVRIGEGCSNAINEAMYWSKPVITNSTPFCDNGQVEQVDHLVTGVIASSSADFGKTILRLKHDPAWVRRLGQNGHKKVMKYYESKLVAKEFENQVKELFGKPKRKTFITVTKLQLKEFRNWYNKNINGGFLDSDETTAEKLFFFPVRLINFLEYRYFND